MPNTKKTNYIFAVGRRKTATARARLYPANADIIIKEHKLSKGDVYVNDLPNTAFAEIFRSTNTASRYITTVKVEGSGKTGQYGAVLLAISRALALADQKYKEILARRGFLSRDPRAKERKKPGLMGARKQKSSPKR